MHTCFSVCSGVSGDIIESTVPSLLRGLIGQRYGRLVITSEAPRRNDKRRFICRCDCGRERTVPLNSLRTRNTQSCGCLHGVMVVQRCYRHGHTKRGHRTPEYRAWAAMKERCYRTTAINFPRYGGRGIRVCDEWQESFEAFLRDVGPRPYGASLDRINSDGHYEPGNVRWATRLQQANNTRRNRVIEWNGTRHTLSEWSRLVGIDHRTLSVRLLQLKWPIARALSEPVSHQNHSM